MPDDPDASDAHYQELTRLLIRTINDLEREYNDAHERNRERLTRKIDNQRRRPGVLHLCAFCERTFSTVDGRVVAGGRDPRGSGVVPGLRPVGDRARPPPRGGPGPADLDRPVVLVWAKRLWRCSEPGCPAGTWSEDSDEIAPRAVLTEQARAEICRRVGPG